MSSRNRESERGTKRILLVHPEGNIHDNPNLYGIVQILCENRFWIDILCLRRPEINQAHPHARARLIGLPADRQAALLDGHFIFSAGQTKATDLPINGKPDLVIGIDRGIIDAARIAADLSIPLGFFSYEIFFAEEAGLKFKVPEIEACRNVAFAMVQDPLRGRFLAQENSISKQKMLYIPVAGRGIVRGKQSSYWHERFRIPRAQKVALYAGSAVRRAHMDFLLAGVEHWPADWVLVVHDRYGLRNPEYRDFRNRYQGSAHIFFSTKPIRRIEHLGLLLHAADIGVAFYQEVAGSIFAGKNIRHVGMSSGKISTYLQHGLPVLVNEIGQISSAVKRSGLGLVMHGGRWPKIFPGRSELGAMRNKCFNYYQRHLDLNRTILPLLETLKKLTA